MSDFSPILVLQFKASINRNKTWQDTNKIRKTHTKHCNRQRKALHPPTQSIAIANAKHCNRQRKALQPPTQSIATANAKHCNRQRKALHPPTQSIASANANVCGKRRLRLVILSHVFPQSPHLWFFVQIYRIYDTSQNIS